MIRVLIVDDSMSMRRILTQALAHAEDIEVVDTAKDPYEAREKILQHQPDVVTLDIEMPRMDGLTFLKKLMEHYPTPVVIISSFTSEGSDLAIRALEEGAVEVMGKSEDKLANQEHADLLAMKIRLASGARLRNRTFRENIRPRVIQSDIRLPTDKCLLAIGASTGGPDALAQVLKKLPATIPGTVMVQHMPKQFTAAFAKRLNEITHLKVKEAAGGEVLSPGEVYLAPGGRHLLVKPHDLSYVTVLKDGPQVFNQRPSVEVLFNSVAKSAGARAVGVILTGMGRDGAGGLLAMRDAGARTIAQDSKTSVVYGMPKAAVEIGAAEFELSLENIPQKIVEAFQNMA